MTLSQAFKQKLSELEQAQDSYQSNNQDDGDDDEEEDNESYFNDDRSQSPADFVDNVTKLSSK